MSWLSCLVSNVGLAFLLGLMACFVQRYLRRHAIARMLWLFALIKLVTPPGVSMPLGGSAGRLACSLGMCGCGQHAQIQTFLRDRLSLILLAVWAIGAVATFWLAWRRWRRFRRLMQHAKPAPSEWQSLATRLAAQLSIRRQPEILAMPSRLPPMVLPGWPRARVLVPMDLMDRLSAPQRHALLMHELVHIKRGDHLVRLLELSVGIVYWWLPIVGLIGRQLRVCEESCCDAAVVANLPHGRREYARLLLDVLDFANPVSRHSEPQATAMSAVDDLEQRLRAILEDNRTTRRAWPVGVFAVVFACTILPCELRYDFAPPPARAIPAALSDTVVEREFIPVYCCPS